MAVTTTHPRSHYRDIPDNVLQCLVNMRHLMPADVAVFNLRITGDPTDYEEEKGACVTCTTHRTLRRVRQTGEFVTADYEWPEGYRCPCGLPWERRELRREQRRRHPAQKGVVRRDPGQRRGAGAL